MALPRAGAVLGIDVGYSPVNRSSAVCRLDWGAQHIHWIIQRFRALPAEQEQAIAAVAGNVPLQAAAFDGPLRAGLAVIDRYRVAERMLTRRLQPRIGKPGQASAPVGRSLNQAANDCARIVLARGTTAPASHLTADGTLQALLAHLLPGRPAAAFDQVTDHDDRAALVCAPTALCVATGDFTAVGDADGWIILPPPSFVRPWAWPALQANAAEEAPGCLYRTSD